jgi:hypothetical protein
MDSVPPAREAVSGQVGLRILLALRGRSSVGRASPCQGEGRRFETGRPLQGRDAPASCGPGGVAEWFRQGSAKPFTPVQFRAPPRRAGRGPGRPRALSSAGERFPDTEEVTGSIPVAPTRQRQPRLAGIAMGYGPTRTEAHAAPRRAAHPGSGRILGVAGSVRCRTSERRRVAPSTDTGGGYDNDRLQCASP